MNAADKIVHGTAVFTGNTLEPTAGAIAICGNEIAAIGTLDELEQLGCIGPDTELIDCGNRLIMPGLNDSHLHLLMGCVASDEDLCLNLMACGNEDACARAVAAYDAEHPGEGWLFGWGWICQLWDPDVEPTRASLDALGIDRPIYLAEAGLHVGWCNTRGLVEIGIDPDGDYSDDPFVTSGPDGKPTGVVSELVGQRGIAAALQLTREGLGRALGKLIPKLNARGITAVGDMYPLLVECDEPYGGYRDAVEKADGSLRITFYPSAEDYDGARRCAREFRSERLRFGGVKFVLDGCCEAGTGFMHEPYRYEGEPDNAQFVGCPQATEEHLDEMVQTADADGHPIRIHAIGDAAATMALDAMEKAAKLHGKKGLRCCIEHTDSIKIADIDRMARMGVSAAVQPCHSIVGGLLPGGYETIIGPERTAHMWRYRDELDHGVILGLGTDWPCAADVDPFLNIYAAVARSTKDGTPREGLYRENAMTLGEALQAYTRGSAYAEGFETRIGTLAPGKLADIAVLDCNPFELDIMELKDMHAAMTIFDGKVVYRVEGL